MTRAREEDVRFFKISNEGEEAQGNTFEAVPFAYTNSPIMWDKGAILMQRRRSRRCINIISLLWVPCPVRTTPNRFLLASRSAY